MSFMVELGARTQFCQKLPAATERFQDWGLILLTFASPCASGHGSSASQHLLSLLGYNHISRCKVVSHWGFDLHFSGSHDVEHLFMLPVGSLYIFFEEMSSQNLCPFFNWIICLLLWSCLHTGSLSDI